MDRITVGDLLCWEPRLRYVVDGPSNSQSREVTWAVAARLAPPVVPALRGAEVVLLPEAVLAEPGITLSILLGELASQRVAAIVLDSGSSRHHELRGDVPIPVLAFRGPAVSMELESELNRLLTERRGEMYRLGTELGRLLSNLTASGAGLKRILDMAYDQIQIPVLVADRNGIVLASATGSGDDREEPSRVDQASVDPNLVAHGLRGGGRIWLGPVAPERHAIARTAADRLAGAVESALNGANWFRSRGPERADELTAFVLTVARREVSDGRVQAVALGIDPGADFRVVMASSAGPIQSLHRAYAPSGTIHELARIDGFDAALIEMRPGRGGVVDGERRGSWLPPTLGGGLVENDWLAQSASVTGVASLTEAGRQASYLAGLLRSGMIQRSVVSFDRSTDLGSFRLLYPFWGSPDLAKFASDILGDLISEDRNGTLRQTLLHFLESGGSRVEAAQRAAIHRNTLTYRLRRIAELTRLDPGEPSDRLSLHLALLALSIPAPGMTGR